MSTPIFGIGAVGIDPPAIQSKFTDVLASNQIVLSEFALAQLFTALRQKAVEKSPTPTLPFPLTATAKGAATHARKLHTVLKVSKPGIKLGLVQTMYANTYGYKQWESMMIDLRHFEARVKSGGANPYETPAAFPQVLGERLTKSDLLKIFPTVRQRTPYFVNDSVVRAIARDFHFEFIPLPLMESLNPATSPTIRRLNQISLAKMGSTLDYDETAWFGVNSSPIIGYIEKGDVVWVKNFTGKGFPIALPFRETGFLYLDRLLGNDMDMMAGYLMDLTRQFKKLPAQEAKDASYTNGYFMGLVMAALFDRKHGTDYLQGVVDDIAAEAYLDALNKNSRYLFIEFAAFVELHIKEVVRLAAISDDSLVVAAKANNYYKDHFLAPHIVEDPEDEFEDEDEIGGFDSIFDNINGKIQDNFFVRIRRTHAVRSYELLSSGSDVTDVTNNMGGGDGGYDYASTLLREPFPDELRELFERKHPVELTQKEAAALVDCADIFINLAKDGDEVAIKHQPMSVYAAFCLVKKLYGPSQRMMRFSLRLTPIEVLALQDIRYTVEPLDDQFTKLVSRLVDGLYEQLVFKQAAKLAKSLLPRFLTFYKEKHKKEMGADRITCSFPDQICFAPASPDELLMWCLAGRADALKHVDSFLWDYWVDENGNDLSKCPFLKKSKGVCQCSLGQLAPGSVDSRINKELGITEENR